MLVKLEDLDGLYGSDKSGQVEKPKAKHSIFSNYDTLVYGRYAMDLKYCCVICATAMSKDLCVATLRMSASVTTSILV